MENKRRNKNKVISTTALLAIVVSTLIIGSSMTAMAEAPRGPPAGVYTLYGSATLDGVPLTAADTDVVISIEVDTFGEVASYTMGSDPVMGDMYKLLVNVYASPADGPTQGATAHIYITKTIKSEILEGSQTIGAPFTTVPLDISAVTDTEPPIIYNLTPPDGSFVNDSTPLIGALYSDAGVGVDASTVKLLVDGTDVTSDATVTSSYVAYTPATPLSEALHTVNVSVADMLGYSDSTEWSFTVDVTSPVVNITSPADGFATNSASMLVTGTVETTLDDPIATVDVNGVSVDVIDDAFTTTVALTEGANTITATAIDRAENVGTDSVSGILDTVAPEVAYAAATPSEIVANGTDETQLLVGARDLASGIDSVTVDLTAIDGSATQALTYIGESLGYSWYNCTTTATVVGEFSLPVNVTDFAKNSNTEKSITLNTTAPPEHVIALRAGWNLISTPISPADTSLLSVMASVGADNWTSVWSYDATGWHRYDKEGPPFLNDLTEMDAGIGYWVEMSADDELVITGSPPDVTSIDLAAGWNLAGYNSQESMDTLTALASLGDDWTSAWTYDETGWHRYDKEGPPFLNDLTEMGPDKGYWIEMSAAGTWTI